MSGATVGSASTRDSEWSALHDPTTAASKLAAIAQAHPEFAGEIARHPNAYPELIAWAAATQNDSGRAPEPLPTTPPGARVVLGRRLWAGVAVLFVGVPLVVQILDWIAAATGNYDFYENGVAYEFWLYSGLPFASWSTILLLIIAGLAITAAILSAPSTGRRLAAIVLIVVPTILNFVLAEFLGGWAWWPIWKALSWTGPFTTLLPAVWTTLIFAAWALSRPLRGAGWAALPIVAVLPLLLEAFAWPFIRYWWGAGDSGSYELRVFLTLIVGTVLIPGVGILLGVRWSAASELRAAAPTRELSAPSSRSYGWAPASERTNLLAILSLVFAFVFSILGVVFGHVALAQIARTGEQGRGFAIAGLVLGYIGVAAGLIIVIFYAVALGMLRSGYGY